MVTKVGWKDKDLVKTSSGLVNLEVLEAALSFISKSKSSKASISKS